MMLNRGILGGRRILSRAAVEVMTALHTGDIPAGFAPGMGYGLTWSVVREPAGTLILFQRTNGGGDVADEINAFMALAASAIED